MDKHPVLTIFYFLLVSNIKTNFIYEYNKPSFSALLNSNVPTLRPDMDVLALININNVKLLWKKELYCF